MTNYYNHMAVMVVLFMILLTIIIMHIIENFIVLHWLLTKFWVQTIKYVHIKQFEC